METCPVCNGTLRQAVTDKERHGIKWNMSYNVEADTIDCRNCIPRGMFASSIPTGLVSLNHEGIPCTHRFIETKLGNCYYKYTCEHCDDSFTIDSGD
jgi:hypothetical protein